MPYTTQSDFRVMALFITSLTSSGGKLEVRTFSRDVLGGTVGLGGLDNGVKTEVLDASAAEKDSWVLTLNIGYVYSCQWRPAARCTD